MKNLALVLLAIAALAAGCGQPTLSATDYNNKIVGEQDKITHTMLVVVEKINSGDYTAALAGLEKSVAQCDSSVNTVGAMEPYEGDVRFRDAALDLFKYYKKALNEDYRGLIEILIKTDGDVTEEDSNRIEVINKDIETQEAKFTKAVNDAQQEFCKKYNVTLAPNNLQKQIDG